MLNALFRQFLIQRSAVVGSVSDQAERLLIDKPLFESISNKVTSCGEAEAG